MPPPRSLLFATTRQLTGLPYITHGYVYDRDTGRAVWGCTHRHRRTARSLKSGLTLARECAERMLRQIQRPAPVTLSAPCDDHTQEDS